MFDVASDWVSSTIAHRKAQGVRWGGCDRMPGGVLIQNADIETVLARISSIGSVIAHGTPGQQKEALAAMFERIEVDHAGDVTHLAPRKWAAALFDLMPKEDPASEAGPNSSLVHLMPPRGLKLTRCTADESQDALSAGWLTLARPIPSQSWTDRTSAMRKLRERGTTLAAIAEQFGVSAERVRQILQRGGL